MFTNLSIDINKKSNLCFSYTDRINSYLHIHCLDDDLTDGLRYDNKQLLKNIFAGIRRTYGVCART